MVCIQNLKTLIKPSQYQKFGIKICDGQTDPHSKLDIEAS